MKSTVLAIATFCAALGSSNAQAQGPTIWIDGVHDCGEWVTARKEDRAQIMQQYALGFLSGMALGRERNFWRDRGVPSRDAIFVWLDNYCQKNPLDTTAVALQALYREQAGPPAKKKSAPR